jgi:hypothetical protein
MLELTGWVFTTLVPGATFNIDLSSICQFICASGNSFLDLSHDSKDGNVDIFNKLSKTEYAGNGYGLQGGPVAFCGVLSQDNHPNHS